jgi:ribose-phosphate pyrophosphokinase
VTHVIGDVAGKRVLMIDDSSPPADPGQRRRTPGEDGRRRSGPPRRTASSPGRRTRRSRTPDKEVVGSDTLPLKWDQPRSKIKTLTIAPILASTIKNVFTDESVSEVFMGENQLF